MSRASKPLSNLLCVAVLAGLPAASAWAQQPPPPPRERGNAQDNGGDNRRGSLSDAVRRVERDTRGEVLSAGTVWMSADAGAALSDAHRRQLLSSGFIVETVALDAIEAAGGSLRCCIGEVY